MKLLTNALLIFIIPLLYSQNIYGGDKSNECKRKIICEATCVVWSGGDLLVTKVTATSSSRTKAREELIYICKSVTYGKRPSLYSMDFVWPKEKTGEDCYRTTKQGGKRYSHVNEVYTGDDCRDYRERMYSNLKPFSLGRGCFRD